MNKLLTAIYCISLATVGWLITRNSEGVSNVYTHGNTLQAATIPYSEYSGQLPLDLVLDQAKRIKQDTIFIHDTVTVTNTKYVRIPVPGHATDTIYVPLSDLPEVECVASVKKETLGVREEQTPGEMRAGPHIVILSVDGKVVYTSENDNHSGRIMRDSTSVSDGQ